MSEKKSDVAHGMEVRLIDGTGSPSGRYAVAWGIPGVSHLNQFTRDTFPDDRVRNFLVEKRGLKVLSAIPIHTRDCPHGVTTHLLDGGRNATHFRYKEAGNDWQFKDIAKNHSKVTAYWDTSEQWGVLLYDGKWWFNGIYLCHRTRAGFTITEVGDTVEDFIRAYVRKRHTALYDYTRQRDGRDPAVRVDDIKVDAPYLTLRVVAYVPKKDTPLDTYGYLRLRIHPQAHGFQVIPVALQPLPLKMMRDRYSINN